MDDCVFCKENLYEKDHERILRKTENFIVLSSLGHFIEGYLLLIPKKHYLSIAQLPSGLFSELGELQQEVRDVLGYVYENPIFCEHGAVSEYKKAGCCIDHAHLHAFPVNVDLSDVLKEHFRSNRKIKELGELKEQEERKTPYLYFENVNESKYVFDAPVVPKQYFRQQVSYETGKPELWDWRRYPEIENLEKCIAKLKDWEAILRKAR